MIRHSVRWLAVVFLTLFLSPAGLAAADDFARDIAAARTLFLQAVDGGKREVRKATRHFRTLRDRYPANTVVQAYLGACTSLQARDAGSGVNKQRYAEEAIKQVEAALAGIPEDAEPAVVLETKLVVAHTFIHMPPFLNRLDAGSALVEELLADARLQDMPAPFRAGVYLAAAKVAKRRGDDESYRRHLNSAMELDADGRNGRRAAAMLAGTVP